MFVCVRACVCIHEIEREQADLSGELKCVCGWVGGWVGVRGRERERAD